MGLPTEAELPSRPLRCSTPSPSPSSDGKQIRRKTPARHWAVQEREGFVLRASQQPRHAPQGEKALKRGIPIHPRVSLSSAISTCCTGLRLTLIFTDLGLSGGGRGGVNQSRVLSVNESELLLSISYLGFLFFPSSTSRLSLFPFSSPAAIYLVSPSPRAYTRAHLPDFQRKRASCSLKSNRQGRQRRLEMEPSRARHCYSNAEFIQQLQVPAAWTFHKLNGAPRKQVHKL